MAWRYTLRVPSWSQTAGTHGEPCVYYQLEVTVIPPDGQSRMRSVGRRYSNFLDLYKKLREELGSAAMDGLDPPPKRSLMAVNRSVALVERRRWELEQWMWRLTERPEIANSMSLFKFAELDAAAKSTATSSGSGMSGRRPATRTGSVASTDAWSDAPGTESSWGGGRLAFGPGPAHAGSGSLASASALLAGSAAASSRFQPGGERCASETGSGAATPSRASSVSGLGGDAASDVRPRPRLALPLARRGELISTLAALLHSIEVAEGDVEDAGRGLQADAATIAQLATRLESGAESEDAGNALDAPAASRNAASSMAAAAAPPSSQQTPPAAGITIFSAAAAAAPPTATPSGGITIFSAPLPSASVASPASSAAPGRSGAWSDPRLQIEHLEGEVSRLEAEVEAVRSRAEAAEQARAEVQAEAGRAAEAAAERLELSEVAHNDRYEGALKQIEGLKETLARLDPADAAAPAHASDTLSPASTHAKAAEALSDAVARAEAAEAEAARLRSELDAASLAASAAGTAISPPDASASLREVATLREEVARAVAARGEALAARDAAAAKARADAKLLAKEVRSLRTQRARQDAEVHDACEAGREALADLCRADLEGTEAAHAAAMDALFKLAEAGNSASDESPAAEVARLLGAVAKALAREDRRRSAEADQVGIEERVEEERKRGEERLEKERKRGEKELVEERARGAELLGEERRKLDEAQKALKRADVERQRAVEEAQRSVDQAREEASRSLEEAREKARAFVEESKASLAKAVEDETRSRVQEAERAAAARLAAAEEASERRLELAEARADQTLRKNREELQGKVQRLERELEEARQEAQARGQASAAKAEVRVAEIERRAEQRVQDAEAKASAEAEAFRREVKGREAQEGAANRDGGPPRDVVNGDGELPRDAANVSLLDSPDLATPALARGLEEGLDALPFDALSVGGENALEAKGDEGDDDLSDALSALDGDDAVALEFPDEQSLANGTASLI